MNIFLVQLNLESAHGGLAREQPAEESASSDDSESEEMSSLSEEVSLQLRGEGAEKR